MNTNTFRNLLQAYSPLPIIRTPSPIEPLMRLSAGLVRNNDNTLWIKRDDEIGPGLGGNKGRMLAYVMADVLANKKKKLATYGGLQSNHARMTTAAAAALGFDTHLFFFEKRPSHMTGNLLLNELLGAKMHFIPIGGNASNSMTLEATIRIVHLISRIIAGPTAYFIPGGGHSVIGCLGYVEAACEICEQVNGLGLQQEKTTIITAAGTGVTLAGLMTGFTLLNSPIRVLGIDIGNLWRRFARSVARLATSTCKALGSDVQFQELDIPLIENKYVGKAYAIPSPKGINAVQLLAQTEGILLDHVYTGKAFAGLLDLIQKGHFESDANLIFLHTGGLPSLWA